MNKRFIITIVIFVFLSGCKTITSDVRSATGDREDFIVYMQPLPHEAGRLSFSLEGISAVRDDGTEIPLRIRARDFKASDTRKQRLVASGSLPPGNYKGLSLKTKSASLKTEDGEAALLVPEKPITLSFPFTMSRQRVTVLFLTLNYAESIKDGFSFVPSFTFSLPVRPIAGLVGYIANNGSHTITVFDKRTGIVGNVIATGRSPKGIVFDQTRRRAYAALSDDNAVQVIDVANGEEINRIMLNAGDFPHELAITPDGRFLLSVNTGSDSVSIIDPISYIELSRIAVGDAPSSITIDRTGRRAYVFNTFSNSISVIDIFNKTIVTTAATEPRPLGGQFNRKGDRLYVFYEGSPYLTVINPVNFSVEKRVFVRPGVSFVKVDTATDMIYMGRKNSPEIEVYDPFSFIVSDYIRVGGGVSYMTIDSEENNLWAVLPAGNAVAAINLNSRMVVSVVDSGDDPYWVAVMGER